MLELPEVITIAEQIKGHVVGKQIARVYPPTKLHKFCWFSDEPANYESKLKDAVLESANGIGIFVELVFDNQMKLCFNDGVNVRLVDEKNLPAHYQLLITFTDKTALVFTVAMYGGIVLHEGDYDNEYYLKSKTAISPFATDFEDYYHNLLKNSKSTLSAKAFLATNQRFPGIGNGVLQDILLEAGIHPKQKILTLSDKEQNKLLESIQIVLQQMIEKGGRDTEKDLFGNAGGYQTKLSKNAITRGCIKCNSSIIKENYMGGSIYYCPNCQKA